MTSTARFRSLERSHFQVRRLAATMDLTLACDDLAHTEPLALRAFQRMQDARPGLPGAASYDGPGGSSVGGTGSTASPTERAAIPKCCNEPDECDCAQRRGSTDRSEADRALLDRTLGHLWFLVRPDAVTLDSDEVARKITQDCLTLRRLVDAWTPRPATDKERREVRAANVAATECALTRENLNAWADVYRTSDLWKLLPERTPVSRWVYDFANGHRRLPTPMEWKRHASTDDDLRSQLIGSVKA